MNKLIAMRITGTGLEILGYFIQLHVNTATGVAVFLLAKLLYLPYFIKTKAFDIVALLSVLSMISISKLIKTSFALSF